MSTTNMSVSELWYPSIIVHHNSPQGIQHLNDCLHTRLYNHLLPHYESQEHSSFCGVASATIILNAASVSDSTGTTGSSKRKYSQSYLFKYVIQARHDTKMLNGMTLEQLCLVLNRCGMKTILRSSNETTVERFELQFRSDLDKYLASDQNTVYIICNFWRKFLARTEKEEYVHSGGHFSPLGCYDKQSDKVLVLETSAKRFPHHWIPVSHLSLSMCTMDRMAKKSRGYILVYK